MKIKPRTLILIAILAVTLAACSSATEEPTGDQVNLILAAYTTPREAYGEIIPSSRPIGSKKPVSKSPSKNPTSAPVLNLGRWWKALKRILLPSLWKLM